MATNYLIDALAQPKTQGEQASESQVKNYSGAYVYAVDDFTRLNRFLILGSEGGSYYVKEKALTKDNAQAVIRALKADGPRAIREIVAVSVGGRAPKNDQALFCLALAMSVGMDEEAAVRAAEANLKAAKKAAEGAPFYSSASQALIAAQNALDGALSAALPLRATRVAAAEALPQVARTGTHLYNWSGFVNSMRGGGKLTRRAIANWYMSKSERDLAMQAVKYVQRNGWSHADMLRVGHPQSHYLGMNKASETRNTILSYMVDGWKNVGEAPHPNSDLSIIWAAERAKLEISEAELIKLVTEYQLPMEVVPTEKRSKAVYEAILRHAKPEWTLRNLGNLTRHGVIATGQYTNLGLVTQRLTDAEAIKRARLHPLAILQALMQYKQGHGDKGSNTWNPIRDVVDALDTAFYLAFDAIQPTGKRWVLGVDVSGSMSWDSSKIAGMNLFARDAAAAMAMVTKRTEPYCAAMAFGDKFQDIGMSAKDTLEQVVAKTQRLGASYTDCAIPFEWAIKNRVEADVFVVYTDNDTNAMRSRQPVVALRDYRQKMGIDAKLVVVGMTAGPFTIASPDDPGMLDVAGFDTSVPTILNQFALGNL